MPEQVLTLSFNYVNSMFSLSFHIITKFVESDERMIQTLQFLTLLDT